MTATNAAAHTTHNSGNDTAYLLGFGTQVALDGRAAAIEKLVSRDTVAGFLVSLIDQVEAEDITPDDRAGSVGLLSAEQQSTPGVSAVIRRGESAIMLHTFSDLGRLTLRLVSARSVPIDLVISEFKQIFAVGRYQSHVTSRFRAFPADGAELERFLVGERAYARLRLDEPLAP